MSADAPPIRVLVVEDNEVNRKVVTRILTRFGCQVAVAEDGVEGVEMAPQGFAIIFMDCSMPRMDGYEATRQIRGMATPIRNTPIVALTAHATPADRMACLSAGMDLWLPKPIAPEDLAAAISRYTQWKPGAAPVVDEQVLDPELAARLRDLAGPDDPEFLAELVEDFRSSAELLIEEAKRAFTKRDFVGVRADAQRLRTASLTVGAAKLTELCERVEHADDDTLVDRGAVWVRDMDQHLMRAVAALGNLGA